MIAGSSVAESHEPPSRVGGALGDREVHLQARHRLQSERRIGVQRGLDGSSYVRMVLRNQELSRVGATARRRDLLNPGAVPTCMTASRRRQVIAGRELDLAVLTENVEKPVPRCRSIELHQILV